MNLTHLNRYPPKKVPALFGLMLSALGELLAKVLPELQHRRQAEHVQRPDRQRAVGGGRRRRLKPYQEVLLTLSQRTSRGAGGLLGCAVSKTAVIG
jgi:hypothetical protein